ncbi:hypothetical protein [Lentzea flava]|uniref:hypothetical protein n=1 Tax=Lentzea flava TaxID=103732 RepID=UPI0020A41977|nr:hypothetical protein [Lentzea flava]MCP2205350.1 hypothetical protein [Lentzea flava]
MKHWPLRARLTFAYVVLTAVSGMIMLGLIVLLSERVVPAGTTTFAVPVRHLTLRHRNTRCRSRLSRWLTWARSPTRR